MELKNLSISAFGQWSGKKGYEATTEVRLGEQTINITLTQVQADAIAAAVCEMVGIYFRETALAVAKAKVVPMGENLLEGPSADAVATAG